MNYMWRIDCLWSIGRLWAIYHIRRIDRIWLIGRWDALAALVLLGVGVAAEWDRLTGPAWIGMDTATAFLPWYTFLGEQLRTGHLPVWNPYEFAGAPFAADPESGWMYLPAMLAFTALPLDAAIRAHMLFHVLLAAVSMYALSPGGWSSLDGGTCALAHRRALGDRRR